MKLALRYSNHLNENNFSLNLFTGARGISIDKMSGLKATIWQSKYIYTGVNNMNDELATLNIIKSHI